MARKGSAGGWTIEGLPAEGPDSRLRKKMMLFGQFVGDWDILGFRYLQSNGKWAGGGRGAIHWRWILGGRGVQDVWGGYDERRRRTIPVGTTVRFYDGKIDAWRCVWMSPVQHAAREFIGTKKRGEIVLEEQTAAKTKENWIFYDVKARSFRWRAERTSDGGKTWKVCELMRVVRRRTSG